jgi:hypothetical protein
MPTLHTDQFALPHSDSRAGHRSLNIHFRMSSVEVSGHTDLSMGLAHIAEELRAGVQRHTNTKEGGSSPLEQGSRPQ